MFNKKVLYSVVLVVSGVVAIAIDATCSECPCQKKCSSQERLRSSTKRMNRRIRRITGDIRGLFAREEKISGSLSVSKILISQEGPSVTIEVPLGEDVDEFDASREGNQLAVNIPQKNQKLSIFYDESRNFLSVATGQSTTEEKKDEDKGSYEYRSSSSKVQKVQSLKDEIDFAKSKVSYNSKNGVLEILIPKVVEEEKKPASQKVEVDIK